MLNQRFVFLIALNFLVCTAAPAAPPHRPAGRPNTAGPAQNAALTQATNGYLGRLRGRLQKNWFLADGNNRVEINAVVAQDGSIDKVEVISTPKNDAAETSASDAFSKSQPFEALPSGVQSAKLILVFHSNVDPHGDSNSNIDSKLEPVQAAKASAPASTK